MRARMGGGNNYLRIERRNAKLKVDFGLLG